MTNSGKPNRKAARRSLASTEQTRGVAAPTAQTSDQWLQVGADAQLMDDARTQWRLGDWSALASIPDEVIEAHSARASIALFCAAAHQQLEQPARVRELVKLARQWGADKKQVVRILTAGVHNTLARAAALSNLEDRALEHFREAVSLGGNNALSDYVVRARASTELQDCVAVSPAARHLLMATGDEVDSASIVDQRDDPLYLSAEEDWCQGNWQTLIKLDNVDLPNHPHRVSLGILAACGHQQLDNGKAEQLCVQAVLGWGGEKARIKRFLLAGIYNRLGKANAYAGDHGESARYFYKSLDTVLGDIPRAMQYLQQRVKNQLNDLPGEELKVLLGRL